MRVFRHLSSFNCHLFRKRQFAKVTEKVSVGWANQKDVEEMFVKEDVTVVD